MLMSVTSIVGTNITVQTKEHFINGTERIRLGFIDIDTGESSNETAETTDITFMIISANLNVNDTIYTSGDFSTWKLNETIVRTYPDGERSTNHLNMTVEYSVIFNQTEIDYYHSMNWYWDRSTGIIVEISWEGTN